MLKSRKFRAMLLGIGTVLLVQYLGLDEAQAQQVMLAVLGLVGSFIGGTAWEDAAEKRSGAVATPTVTSTAGEAKP